MDEAVMDQTFLLENVVKICDKSRPRSKEGQNKKRKTFDSVNTFYEGRELTLNAFGSGIFLTKATQEKGFPGMFASRPSDLARVAKVFDRKVSYHTRLKILSSTQMLPRLPIALAQVKAGNTSNKTY